MGTYNFDLKTMYVIRGCVYPSRDMYSVVNKWILYDVFNIRLNGTQ